MQINALILLLTTKMVILNSEVLNDGKHPACNEMIAMQYMITDSKTTLAFKIFVRHTSIVYLYFLSSEFNHYSCMCMMLYQRVTCARELLLVNQ